MTEAVSNMQNAPRIKPREPVILRAIRLGFRVLGTIAPELSGQIAYKMWITPPRYPVPEREREMVRDSRQHKLDLNGHSIATYHWGFTGPRVLLVHGWSGRGPQLSPIVPALLEQGYQVFAFDAPAHGNSSGKQTNLYEIVDSILALEKKTGPFAAIITHSFGGPCSADAIGKGLKTRCMVNISPPSTTIGLVDKFAATLQLPSRVRNALVSNISQRFGEHVWDDASMVENVRQLEIPALVIHDIDDVDVPWEEGKAVADAMPDARFIRTSGLGHRRILKDTDTINHAVEFIRQQVPLDR